MWICADVDYYLLFKDHQFIYLDYPTASSHYQSSNNIITAHRIEIGNNKQQKKKRNYKSLSLLVWYKMNIIHQHIALT